MLRKTISESNTLQAAFQITEKEGEGKMEENANRASQCLSVRTDI